MRRRQVDAVRERENGFTLIELLVVVAVIGILASIAIPNLLVAIQRAKQKRSMSDIRNLATAWEARQVEVGRYNAAGTGIPDATKSVAIIDLQTALMPTYIKVMPRLDGWGNSLAAFVSDDWGGPTTAAVYAIISPGKDGILANTAVLGPTTEFDCDIIYSNGSFVAWPDGISVK